MVNGLARAELWAPRPSLRRPSFQVEGCLRRSRAGGTRITKEIGGSSEVETERFAPAQRRKRWCHARPPAAGRFGPRWRRPDTARTVVQVRTRRRIRGSRRTRVRVVEWRALGRGTAENRIDTYLPLRAGLRSARVRRLRVRRGSADPHLRADGAQCAEAAAWIAAVEAGIAPLGTARHSAVHDGVRRCVFSAVGRCPSVSLFRVGR